MDTYSTSDINKLFGISTQTVREWTDDSRFGEFFSQLAKPAAKGQHKRFSQEDMEVIAYIHEQKWKYGKPETDITNELRAGARGVIPDGGFGSPSEIIQKMADAEDELQVMQARMTALQIERDRARAEAEVLRNMLEAEQKSRSEITNQLNQTINELNREIGKLQARLEILSEDRDK
jgi:DNA-binding transcriptional MerR regulator